MDLTAVWGWGGQITWELSWFLPFTMWGLGEIQVIRLGNKHPYLLSHLTGPNFYILIDHCQIACPLEHSCKEFLFGSRFTHTIAIF